MSLQKVKQPELQTQPSTGNQPCVRDQPHSHQSLSNRSHDWNVSSGSVQCDVSDDDSGDDDHMIVDIYGNKISPSKEACDQKEASKRHKMEVIRKLLEEFDLEETIDKYKSMSVREYRVDVSQFSSKCSLAAISLRQRLLDLMGTDVIRMNDPKYMEELRRNRQMEYEARMDKEEEDRAEMERARMRRMLKEGVISVEEMKEDPLFLQEYNRTKLKYGRTRPHRQKRSPTRSKSKRAQTASVVEGKSRQSEGRSKNTFTSSPIGNKPSDHPPPNGTRKLPERPRTVHWESRQDRLRFKEERDSEEGDIDYTRWSCHNKFNDPLILKLKDEETVDGLYNIAEEILDGLLPSQRGSDKQGKKLG